MFSEESLSKLINCSLCGLKMNEAKILPCGAFCAVCVDEMMGIDSDRLKCRSCGKSHEIPEEGFMEWKALEEFYSEKLNIQEIYRGEVAEKLKKNLKEIKKNMDELADNFNQSENLVKEHCLKLRNEVMLESETRIKEIQDMSEKMIAEINEYESKCIKNFVKDDHFEIIEFSVEMSIFYEEWNKYLMKHQIKDAEMEKANDLANELKVQFKEKKNELEKLTYGSELLTFKKNTSKTLENFFGTFQQKSIEEIEIES